MKIILYFIYIIYICGKNITLTEGQDKDNSHGICPPLGTFWLENEGCVCEFLKFEHSTQSCICEKNEKNENEKNTNIRHVPDQLWKVNRIVAFQDFNFPRSELAELDPFSNERLNSGDQLSTYGTSVKSGYRAANWCPTSGLGFPLDGKDKIAKVGKNENYVTETVSRYVGYTTYWIQADDESPMGPVTWMPEMSLAPLHNITDSFKEGCWVHPLNAEYCMDAFDIIGIYAWPGKSAFYISIKDLYVTEVVNEASAQNYYKKIIDDFLPNKEYIQEFKNENFIKNKNKNILFNDLRSRIVEFPINSDGDVDLTKIGEKKTGKVLFIFPELRTYNEIPLGKWEGSYPSQESVKRGGIRRCRY
eukprot:GHVL01031280.1.p1 GENE.GHVL01031280.1~~GHVL01031280.1.p1  ORF type:complete len:361 (+),score=81.43 GHVL01031280.1:74-1156(+)